MKWVISLALILGVYISPHFDKGSRREVHHASTDMYLDTLNIHLYLNHSFDN